MITSLHRSMLLPIFVMLLAVAGMSLSAVGEASSHGFAELTGEVSGSHHDHSHSHGESDGKSDEHVHHDTSNHSHESVDHPTLRPVSGLWTLAGLRSAHIDPSPRSFHYRLERPPKAA